MFLIIGLKMSNRKRFVIVQNSLRTVLIFRLSYIKKLLDLGDVVVIAPNDDDSSLRKLEKIGVYVYNIPDDINYLKKIAIINKKILNERLNGSVFICHFISTFIFTYFTLVPFNKKLVVYIEGLGSLFGKNRLFCFLAKILLKFNHAKVLFCNESEIELVGSQKDKVTGGIGVDLCYFKPKDSPIKTDNTFNLLYVGRLIKDKGVLDTIEVLDILLSKNYNVKLTLIGDIYLNNPSSMTYNDIKINESRFGDRIEFLKFKDDIREIYERSDVLLIPSIREGFPVCVMEASAMGIPSVGYDVPGVRDSICHNVNGMLSKFQNLADFTYNVEILLNHEKLGQFRNSCREYAKNNFSAKEKSEEIVSILNNI